MKISCPACTKPLSVRDELAGKRVRCPSCKDVFQASADTAVTTAPAPVKQANPDVPAPVKKSAAKPPAPTAVTDAPGKLKPSRRQCAECGEPLALDDETCPVCGWTAEAPAPNKRARLELDEDEDERDGDNSQGLCYIRIRGDDVDLTEAVEKRMEMLIETEQLDMRITRERAPRDLRANELVITADVNEAAYGSQFVRYFFTFIAMLGPGACKLDVDADVETEEAGVNHIKVRSLQWFGIFGGTGSGLMKQNVQVVTKRITTGAARHATGRWLLNAQAYSCANWSLGLGIASLIPYFAIVLGPISIVLGAIALVTINRRELPRGKGKALAGIVLSLFGFVVTAGMIALALIMD